MKIITIQESKCNSTKVLSISHIARFVKKKFHSDACKIRSWTVKLVLMEFRENGVWIITETTSTERCFGGNIRWITLNLFYINQRNGVDTRKVCEKLSIQKCMITARTRWVKNDGNKFTKLKKIQL